MNWSGVAGMMKPRVFIELYNVTFFIYFRDRTKPSSSLAEVVRFVVGAFRLLRCGLT